MQIRPILSALRMHRAGTMLIALQIALTLAIVCNALFIIQQREEHLSRSTGIDESSLLVVRNQWVGKPAAGAIASLMATDLATLRRLPGVADAYATNAWPLGGGATVFGMGLTADKQASVSETAVYYADDHALATLGLKLVAGRNFRADEIGQTTGDKVVPAVVMVTRDLAEKMFPDGHALGKSVYISARPSTIIGIVERLQVAWVGSFVAAWAERSTLVPYQPLSLQGGYVIRAKPGQLDALAHAVPKALIAANRMRVIDQDDGVQTFGQVRAHAYRGDRGMAVLMGVICLLLLAITAAGIVGLTSFWVGQRRRQIGVRRALGATKRDIVDYFLTENLLIGLGGVCIGALLAEVVSLWLVAHFEFSRMPAAYLGAGVVVLLLLGQGAVLAPALRASNVPPVEATRPI